MSTKKPTKKESVDLGSKPLRNPKHELFCHLYAGSHTRELFGNGRQCAIDAYQRRDEFDTLKTEITDMENRRYFFPAKSKMRNEFEMTLADKKLALQRIVIVSGHNADSIVRTKQGHDRIAYLLNKFVEDSYSMGELGYVIGQRHDLRAKVMAIEQANKMKESLGLKTPSDIEITFNTPPGWEKQKKPGSSPERPAVTVNIKQPTGEPSWSEYLQSDDDDE